MLRRGVYSVGHERLSMRGHWMAAVLSCGEDALLSYLSAAALWGLVRPRSPIEVSSKHWRKGRGLVVHSGRIHAEDRAVVDAIPVTSLAHTLLDLVEVVDGRRYEHVWEEADRRGLLELRAMERICARSNGRRGLARIRVLIEAAREPVRTRSPLEDRFAIFCREQLFPSPVFNVTVLDHEVDVLWPRERLIVELDGFEFHSHRAAFEDDRMRDAAFQVAGYRVLHLTYQRLEKEPSEIASEIRHLLNLGQGLAADSIAFWRN